MWFTVTDGITPRTFQCHCGAEKSNQMPGDIITAMF
jgi:hypothetical protein